MLLKNIKIFLVNKAKISKYVLLYSEAFMFPSADNIVRNINEGISK